VLLQSEHFAYRLKPKAQTRKEKTYPIYFEDALIPLMHLQEQGNAVNLLFFKVNSADYGINLFYALPGGAYHFHKQLRIEGH